MSGQRKVVCAANKYGNYMFIGVRYFCPIMCKNMETYDIPWLRKEFGEEQGFIDQYGVFLNRKEALQVALDAHQMDGRQKTTPYDRLFSEDIY